MTRFEERPIEFIPRRLLDNPRAIEKGLKIRQQKVDRWRPNPLDFVDETQPEYTEKKIKRDLREVELLKEQWEEEDSPEEKKRKKVADIYEAVLVDSLDRAGWFGDGWEVVVTTEYDDYKNGIDAVLAPVTDDSAGNEGPVGLAFDVTFTGDKERLERKLNSIKALINNGNLPTVKYFQDSDGNKHKGPLTLPKIVLGSRYASAERLINLWISDDSRKNEKLAADPTQTKLLLEAIFQLRYFYEYANRPNQYGEPTNPEAAKLYGEAYNTFHEIYKDRMELVLEHYPIVSDDVVFDTIRDFTGH